MNKRRRPRKKQPKIVERRLGREQAWGQFWFQKNLVEIDPRQLSKHYLNTVVHEHLHAAYPKMSEREVIRGAKIITRAVWACRYRKIEK